MSDVAIAAVLARGIRAADELHTVREAMRDFGSLLTELEDGEVEKLVLTQRNRVRAVVVSVERWSELDRRLERHDDGIDQLLPELPPAMDS
jgi:PHD/YefM family antitoxin component YafN of YafNO toxin-antitoxin module